QHQLDLPRLHGVALRVGNALVGGADHGDRVDGDDDVAVVGHLAAVDHGVQDPVVDRHHRPLAGLNDELDVDGAGHVSGPGAGGVDDEVGRELHVFAAGEITAP